MPVFPMTIKMAKESVIAGFFVLFTIQKHDFINSATIAAYTERQ